MKIVLTSAVAHEKFKFTLSTYRNCNYICTVMDRKIKRPPRTRHRNTLYYGFHHNEMYCTSSEYRNLPGLPHLGFPSPVGKDVPSI